MEIAEKVALTEQNIRKAIKDYWKHTSSCENIEMDISNAFIQTLAENSVRRKSALRDMLRRSPAWNEELDALVINGNTTHDPDYGRIEMLARKILIPAIEKAVETYDPGKEEDIYKAIFFFSEPTAAEEDRKLYLDALNRLAPKAYAPGKKTSRVFKALCIALGIADDAADSEFQRLFAQIADEMSAKQISFKLFLSVNPAHFLTMSNPKGDTRGSCLTSCHSFNCTDYSYNNGCTGYACDSVTMIAFTVSNPDDPETLNNRKTTRQLFMYQPGSGVLLQSRMYNTSGGTYGAVKESKLYRDLVQRAISDCEDAVNLWDTCKYVDNSKGVFFEAHYDFGGYADWGYGDYEPMLSIRIDHATDHENRYIVGAPGLCISCGDETESGDGLYCEDCKRGDTFVCHCCGESYPSDEANTVYEDGDSYTVCEDCLETHYSWCEDCERYVHENEINEVFDDNRCQRWVCDECRENNYEECDECGDMFRHTYSAVDAHGHDTQVCDRCAEFDYITCEECGELVHRDYACEVHNADGCEITVCEDCRDEQYAECKNCDEWYHKDTLADGLCPECREEAEEDKHESEVA